ncbi:hypothetical protein DL95DRAFT_377111 [Leptodontidium sp. 2 PMI_412]|nr:hypothetical protein DL95DRAFT_377111 [Leptodontidium sp. 2 PMI_412]
MSEIKSVAIAGASGNLGPHVLKALLDPKLHVTVLTRGTKSITFDPAVKVVSVDYSSVESLTSALQGQDAVVSAVGMEALEGQTILIDAAIAAGVKRFIPADYGAVTTNPKLHEYPFYSTVGKIQKYLAEKSKSTGLSYTVLSTGAFTDMLFGAIGIIDFDKHEAVLYDGGDSRFSTNSMAGVGKAIAQILKHPKETSNRMLRISEAILTQNKLLAIAKELKPEITWKTTLVDTSEMMKEALASFGAGDFSPPVFMKFLGSTVFAGNRFGAAYDVTDNELLGVEALSDESLKKLVAGRLG